ncbi:MAG: Crp/Fnr family transcriptional regulator [Anaerolineae bacterium]|nr:Crp/Fnr family transcriptional regulator [Anaerolineae bacterium]MCA9894721.1 Crp/Fnr family transcriptional regulator [Anaerolineae bacterium]
MVRPVHVRNLDDVEFFQNLEAQTVSELTRIAVSYELESGMPLYQVGDYARQFYLIKQGGIRLIESTAEGKVVNLKVYGPGDIFGVLVITRDYRHASSAVTIRPTVIFGFDGVEAREIARRHGDFALKIVDKLTEHTHHAHDRIRNLAAERTAKRLAGALLHFHDKFGHEDEGNLVIAADLTQRDISEFTGTTLETVNRYLRNWEKAGYVQIARKRIDILDEQALQEIVMSQASEFGYLPE